MKIILLSDIKKLGKRWDIKRVTDGYARNFLFPRGLARLANQDALEKLDEELRKREIIATEDLKGVEGLVASLDGLDVILKTKTTDGGKLYATINTSDVKQALISMGYKVPLEVIKLEEPIKELGEYKIPLEFDHGLEAEIKLIIEEDKK